MSDQRRAAVVAEIFQKMLADVDEFQIHSMIHKPDYSTPEAQNYYWMLMNSSNNFRSLLQKALAHEQEMLKHE